MDKQEKIVCAAVQFVYEYRNEVVMCLDYDDDRVQEHKYRDLDFGVIAPFKNGFITSKNRFVDAKEAMQIALDNNQIFFINILQKEYDDEVIKNRGVSEIANTLFKALSHQKEIYKYKELKPSDLY